jgi:hypothetical protein
VVKWRWYYNLFITFFLSGVWHGANWTFALWGALHGCYMVIDSLLGRWRESFRSRLKSNAGLLSFQGLNMGITFCLVGIAWVPFRANNIHDAWYILTHFFAGATTWFDLRSQSLNFRGMGLNLSELLYAVLFAGMVIAYDVLDSRSDFWQSLLSRPRIVRWAVYYLLLFFLLFFAPYNQAQNFIYFQF